jgi:hypothetical protein
MTDKLRIRVAAIVTALFLAGLSIAGVALHTGPHVTADSTPPAAVSSSGQPSAATPVVLRGEEGDHE